jgi:hypothetical protein
MVAHMKRNSRPFPCGKFEPTPGEPSPTSCWWPEPGGRLVVRQPFKLGRDAPSKLAARRISEHEVRAPLADHVIIDVVEQTVIGFWWRVGVRKAEPATVGDSSEGVAKSFGNRTPFAIVGKPTVDEQYRDSAALIEIMQLDPIHPYCRNPGHLDCLDLRRAKNKHRSWNMNTRAESEQHRPFE